MAFPDDRRHMVGERLAELREQKALTLRDLEEASGVGADAISKIENGHRKPRPSTLRKLARALGAEVEDFFRQPALPLAEAPRGAGQAQGEEVRNLDEVAQEALRRIEEMYDQERRASARLDASEGVPQTYFVEAETKLVGLFAPLHRDAAPQVLSMIGLDLRRRIAQLEEEKAQLREERERVEAEKT
jgi:transcriptional regulator with XRE-family HTH domain